MHYETIDCLWNTFINMLYLWIPYIDLMMMIDFLWNNTFINLLYLWIPYIDDENLHLLFIFYSIYSYAFSTLKIWSKKNNSLKYIAILSCLIGIYCVSISHIDVSWMRIRVKNRRKYRWFPASIYRDRGVASANISESH